MAELDIHSLHKIEGEIVSLQNVSRQTVMKYKEDCQRHVDRINQDIEELQEEKRGYVDDIKKADELLKRG